MRVLPRPLQQEQKLAGVCAHLELLLLLFVKVRCIVILTARCVIPTRRLLHLHAVILLLLLLCCLQHLRRALAQHTQQVSDACRTGQQQVEAAATGKQASNTHKQGHTNQCACVWGFCGSVLTAYHTAWPTSCTCANLPLAAVPTSALPHELHRRAAL